MPDIQLFYNPNISSSSFTLDEQESKHLIRVLRKSAGDEVFFTDGKGNRYQCAIAVANSKKAMLDVLSKETMPVHSRKLSIAIAPTKNMDRIEFFAEKATEIGVHEIIPILCQRSERKHLKVERLQKIVVSAMKQSLKYELPLVHDLTPFSEAINNPTSQKFIAHLDEQKPGDQFLNQAAGVSDAMIFIGPEGDFTAEELALAYKQNIEQVLLGHSRLRTETAGVMAAAVWNSIS